MKIYIIIEEVKWGWMFEKWWKLFMKKKLPDMKKYVNFKWDIIRISLRNYIYLNVFGLHHLYKTVREKFFSGKVKFSHIDRFYFGCYLRFRMQAVRPWSGPKCVVLSRTCAHKFVTRRSYAQIVARRPLIWRDRGSGSIDIQRASIHSYYTLLLCSVTKPHH